MFRLQLEKEDPDAIEMKEADPRVCQVFGTKRWSKYLRIF